MSNTSRSLELLRTLGYEPAVVEKFNYHAGPHGIRQDLFGLADVEAIADDHTLYVQCCSASTAAAHVTKCLEEKRLVKLLACTQRRFEIWSWDKRRKRGEKRELWTLRRHRARIVDATAAFVVLAVTHELETVVKG